MASMSKVTVAVHSTDGRNVGEEAVESIRRNLADPDRAVIQ